MSRATDDLQRFPWIRRMSEPRACDGIKWGTVAGRDVHYWGPGRRNEPRGIQDKSRCGSTAWWWFRPLAGSDLAARYLRGPARAHRWYCWQHLQAATASERERQRAGKWLERHAGEAG